MFSIPSTVVIHCPACGGFWNRRYDRFSMALGGWRRIEVEEATALILQGAERWTVEAGGICKGNCLRSQVRGFIKSGLKAFGMDYDIYHNRGAV